MSQSGILNISSSSGIVNSVTGTHGVTAAPTTGNVVVSGVNATTASVGVASFNPANFTVNGAGQVSLIGSAVLTLTGNDGIPEAAIANNFNIVTSNSTVKFTGSAGTETLNFGITNLLLGDPGINISGAGGNVGYGVGALTALTNAGNVVAIGFFAGHSLTTASGCTLVGSGAGSSITSGSNTLIGNNCANAITTGTSNTCLGSDALGNAITSVNCIVLGHGAASSYVGAESSNIVIGNLGIVGESNVIRIGSQGSSTGQQNACFIAGINGVTSSNPLVTTINSSTNQLGVIASVNDGVLITSNAGVPSFLANGTTGQVLTATTGSPPSWQAASGASAPTFSVALTSATGSISSGVLTQVTYDTAVVDTASGFSAGVYTIPAGGTGNWNLSAVFSFATSVSFTACDVFLNKNSGTFLLHLQPSTPTDGITVNNGSGSGIFPLVAGDTLQISVFATTTGAAALTGQGASNGFFNIFTGYKVS